MSRQGERLAGISTEKVRPDIVVMSRFVAVALRLWFRVYGRWEVLGRENIPRSGPLLIAANHASNLDPFLGWAAVHGCRRMYGVAKIELWKNRISAYLMACVDAIPVRRGAADRTMIRRVLDLLAHGEAVGLFPEGTRTSDGRLQPAQPGVAMLAQKSGAPILPVALMGTYEMLPRGRSKLRRARLKVVFGTPLHFAPDCPREEILQGVMAAIANLMTANGRPTDPPTPERRPAETEGAAGALNA